MIVVLSPAQPQSPPQIQQEQQQAVSGRQRLVQQVMAQFCRAAAWRAVAIEGIGQNVPEPHVLEGGAVEGKVGLVQRELAAHKAELHRARAGASREQAMVVRAPWLRCAQHEACLVPVVLVVLQLARHVHGSGGGRNPTRRVEVCASTHEAFHSLLVFLEPDAVQGGGSRGLRLLEPVE
eukprot:CAMPEP_0185203658 /NCGR_PEP_ID=MMETSP1140-20130426/53425_1 /TAXON_ID=298111 /ORGANISM="Pavlova sp., Strain CCMP459" /LENGTH=178 /DNA_ID=CAMNT_0027771171 /DNA_START=217 /DNA_END=754 /DNA_ORIENTATION=+